MRLEVRQATEFLLTVKHYRIKNKLRNKSHTHKKTSFWLPTVGKLYNRFFLHYLISVENYI